MRTVRVLAVLAALMLPFISTPTASADEPIVRFEGHQFAGQWVTAAVDGVEGDVVHEWFVDGVATPSLLPTGDDPSPWPDQFFLREEYLGAHVAAVVVVTSDDGHETTLTSESFVVGEGYVLMNVPQILEYPTSDAPLLVGQTLSAEPGRHYPEVGTTFTYRWLHDRSIPIPGATGPTLELTDAHLNMRRLTVEITASKPGWRSTTQSASTPWELRVLPATIQSGTIRLTDQPRVGEITYIREEGFTCCYEDPVYEVLLNGRVVDRGNVDAVMPKADWVGGEVTVRSIRSRPGVRTVTVTSKPYKVLGERPLDVYTTPGTHFHNGRHWSTRCEPYSQTTRCRTDIDATTVHQGVDGSYELVTDWTFNSLTYLPSSAALWKSNPLAHPGAWTADDGRRWKTECYATTLPHTCRSYAWTDYLSSEMMPNGRRYFATSGWVFNNQVHLR